MANSIRLHKQYGLNPTLCTCFYCGKETGEIALLGANYNGEAPMHSCTSLEPCAKCKETFKDRVLLVEVSQEGRQSSPAGRWLAIPREAIKAETPRGVALITEDTFRELTRGVQ